MNYKDKFYARYITNHTKSLYGETSLEEIKKQFPIWDSYFDKLLPENKNIKILDLGCGNGGFVYWLHKKGFESAIGVDISEEQVGQARKLGIKNVFQGDAKKFLENRNEEYNLIFARDFLEHFSKEEILELTDLISNSLEDSGVFIAQIPNAENLLWGRLRHGDFTHDISFTQQSIKQLLKVSKFDEINVFPQRPVIHGFKSFIRYILWRFLELWPKFYLLIETRSSKGIFTQNILVYAKKSEQKI